MNDADLDMARLEATAARLDRIERATGQCTHGHHREQPDGTCVCLRCGRTWPTAEQAMEAHEAFFRNP